LVARGEGGRVEPGLRRKAGVLGTAIALIALAVGAVFGDRGILNLIEKRDQVDSLRHEVEALQQENAQLSGEITALRQSPLAIERLAREQLGLARPDETVFLIREPEGAPR